MAGIGNSIQDNFKKNGGAEGLLQNPLFNVGLGVYQASNPGVGEQRDYGGAIINGLLSSAQNKEVFAQRQREEEERARAQELQEKLAAAFQAPAQAQGGGIAPSGGILPTLPALSPLGGAGVPGATPGIAPQVQISPADKAAQLLVELGTPQQQQQGLAQLTASERFRQGLEQSEKDQLRKDSRFARQLEREDRLLTEERALRKQEIADSRAFDIEKTLLAQGIVNNRETAKNRASRLVQDESKLDALRPELDSLQALQKDLDQAIQLTSDANFLATGPVAQFLPNFKGDTQVLSSLYKQLGLDRLSAFKGSQSEKELQVAFQAGANESADKDANLVLLNNQRKVVLQQIRRVQEQMDRYGGNIASVLQPSGAKTVDNSLLNGLPPDISQQLSANSGLVSRYLDN